MEHTLLFYFSLWVALVLSVTYLLSAHFLSSITVHILHLLHRLGWDRGEERKEWWDAFPEFEPPSIQTPDGKEHSIEWQDWFIMAFNETWGGRMIADLITCPICISFHLSLWSSALAFILLYFALSPSPWVFALIPLYAFSVAPTSLILYNYVRRQHI